MKTGSVLGALTRLRSPPHIFRDAETGQELIDLKGHKGSINCVNYSPDGKHIVSYR
jgi:WD40 repeat protein